MLSNHPNVLGGAGDTSQSGAPVVGGPSSSTDNALVRWDGTTGQLVKNGIVTEANDTGTLTGPTFNATTTAVGSAFTNQPANDGVEILSSSALDITQTATVIGTTFGGNVVVVETVALNGTTLVATVKTDWGIILAVKLSASCAGTITFREASADLAITTVTTGNTSKGVTLVAAANQLAYGRTLSAVSDGATTKQIGFKGTDTSDAVIYDSKPLNGATAVTSNSSFRTVTEIYTGDVEAARTETVTTNGAWTLTAGNISLVATGTNQNITVTPTGTGSLVLATNLTFGTSASILGGTTGSIGLTATGTNQSITLTPSGTGSIVNQFATTKAILSDSNSPGNPALYFLATATAISSTNYSFQSNGSALFFNAPSSYMSFSLANVEKARFAATTGNLLLGGLMVDGTGVLQLPSGAADKTSGIGFNAGAGPWLFSPTANTTLKFLSTGTTMVFSVDTTGAAVAAGLNFASNGTLKWDIGYAVGTGSGTAFELYNRVTGANALSIASADSTATFAGAIIGAVQALSGAGAVNVTQLTTAFTSTGGAQALTLANGSAGQIKTIVHVVDGGSGVLTPTTKTGYTTITFTNAGDAVTLQYFTTQGWCIVGIFGAVAA